jgi:outer membrane lipoprotein-sorting protein
MIKQTINMKRLPIILAMILFMAGIPQVLCQEMTAKEVVRKAQDKVNGKSSKGNISMTIVRPDWSREVEMKIWSLGEDFYMIYITAPVKDKGQVFMKRYNDMWNWMPSINRMIKIPPSMMGQSWMGSDFTNDDLVEMNSMVEDYEHSFLEDEEYDGFDCYKVQFIPRKTAAVVWGKIIVWITKDEFYELKAEYYDEDEILVNTMYASEIEMMGDRKLPSKMEMVPGDKEGHKTVMKMKNMDYDIQIEESFFSQQNMKRVR